MSTRRIVTIMVALFVAGGICIAIAYCYMAAWASDVLPSLLLATLLPAYLAVSMIRRIRPHRSTSPRRHFLLRQSATDCRNSRHG